LIQGNPKKALCIFYFAYNPRHFICMQIHNLQNLKKNSSQKL
jgi:hypothetical protein